ncbi:MAG: hypothetical protein IT342_04385 [Candidatus Melainabacteria bacterium]|nr:hypothetical protein [Candidatus Melainabacteria bacterium]
MEMSTKTSNAKDRVSEARRLLLLARASNAIVCSHLPARAVKLMKPFFSNNNPELGEAYVQLARARYAVWHACGAILTLGARRRLLARAIVAMKAGVKVFERGMSTDKLAHLQLQLAFLYEQQGAYPQSARRYQSALITMAAVRGCKLSAADLACAAHGFKRNALLAAAVEHELPPLKFNAWRRVFHP